MKKKIAVIVVGIMVMLLAACGDATAERESEYKKKSVVTQAANTTVTPTNIPTVTPETTVTLTPAEGSMFSSTYEKGTMTDTGFESEWLNLRFVAPEGVAMATQEELDVLMDAGADVVFGDNAETVLAYAETRLVYEMLAKHSSGANVAIEVELIPVLNQNMTEEQYLQILEETTEKANFSYVFDDEVYTCTFVGEEYVARNAVITYDSDYMVYQKMMVRKQENRMILIALTYAENGEEAGEYLLSQFDSYDSERTALPTSVPKPEDTYVKGTITEDGFESEWIGLSFQVPEGMIMATQEEMDALMQQGTESIFGEKVASGIVDYACYNMVYEMQATYAIGAPSVQILVEKASYRGMTAEAYADLWLDTLQLVENKGVVCTVHDTLSNVELAGQEYMSMTVELDYAAGAVVKQRYYIREKDGRMIVIALTYVDELENYLQEVLDGFSAYEKAAPEVFDSLALDTLRAEASATGSLCAAAYLGYQEGNFAEFMTFVEKSDRLEQFPFLRSLSKENTVLASGGEWYVLVPVDENITFTVSEAILDETTYALVAGQELLQVGNGELLLLRGNVSDIFPSFMVTVTGADRETINYAPGLSLKDGKLLTRDGVYDFTVYGE